MKRDRRLSITRLQRASASVVELINLCQTVTADGLLSDGEIAEIRRWLEDNEGVDIPAHEFLRSTVERILEDGFVTDDERRDLYLAIEKVLPPDVRADVRGVRTALEQHERDAWRAKKAAAKEAALQARRLARPIARWNFMVAGVRYEGRAAVIRQFVHPGQHVVITRDPANPFSRNASEIRLDNGMQIGFVPEIHAVELAPLLDAGHKYDAYVTKVLTGGRVPIPVVQLNVMGEKLPGAALDEGSDRSMEAESPHHSDRPGAPHTKRVPSRHGCLLVAVVLPVTIVLSFAVMLSLIVVV